jgi:hypothetical protein
MGSDSKNDSTHYLNLSMGDMKYKNTFLAIANFGRPTYQVKELNFFGVIGNIRDQFNLSGTVFIGRVGAEYNFKIKERFKCGNQISIGPSFYNQTPSNPNYFTAHINNSIDVSLSSRIVIGLCQYVGIYQGINTIKDYFDYSLVSSLAYIINPDIKLRFNMFYDREEHWNNRKHLGAYVQLIAGFGKRL